MFIDVIGTERFWDNWNTADGTNRGSPDSHLNDVKDFIETVWNAYVVDSGDYTASFYYWTAQIPESTFSGSDLYNRRVKANEWLDDNWSPWTDTTAGVVVDHIHDGDAAAGVGTPGGVANHPSEKFAIVDTYGHDNGDWDQGLFSVVQSQGICAHEIGHQFGANHADGSLYSSDTASLLADENAGAGCVDAGSNWVWLIDKYSSCNASIMGDYIDDNNLDN